LRLPVAVQFPPLGEALTGGWEWKNACSDLIGVRVRHAAVKRRRIRRRGVKKVDRDVDFLCIAVG
jgi:hypothetical protein